jgi:hypothetical protein
MPKRKKKSRRSSQVRLEPEEDPRVEKSQLLARLDEMKRAIDGFKQLKQAKEEPVISKQSSLVMDVSQTTSALEEYEHKHHP